MLTFVGKMSGNVTLNCASGQQLGQSGEKQCSLNFRMAVEA
jgi:hypothetical protein